VLCFGTNFRATIALEQNPERCFLETKDSRIPGKCQTEQTAEQIIIQIDGFFLE
jgi:hypothetical protein